MNELNTLNRTCATAIQLRSDYLISAATLLNILRRLHKAGSVIHANCIDEKTASSVFESILRCGYRDYLESSH